jgi:hypothetical protein
MAGDEPIGGIEDAVGDDAEEAPERPGQPQRDGELARAGAVTDRRAARTHEVPGRVALALGQVREERRRIVVAHGQKGELLIAVEPGDDTRRPPAETSVGVVDEGGVGRSDGHLASLRA